MSDSLLLLAGFLIDGTGGPIRRHILLEAHNGLITSLKSVRLGELSSIDCIDLSHCTVLPGLVDAHVHLCMSGTGNLEIRQKQLSLTYEQAAEFISLHLRQHLAHGIVAVRDGGDYGGHTFRYKKESLPEADLPIHVSSAGKAWRSRGRYGRLIGRPPKDGQTLASSIEQLQEKPDQLKIVNSGLNSLKEFGRETAPQFDETTLAAAFRCGLTYGLKAMVHANGSVPVRVALEAGCHSIEHGFFMGQRNLEWMAERQIFWVPTAFSMKAYLEMLGNGSLESEISRRNLDHQLEQIRTALELGVPIAVGTDSGGLGIDHGKAFTEELKLLVDAGFSIEGAVQCATQHGARLLGLENELGRLKKGMPATFVVVHGDPSCLPEALRSPKQVYIRGRPWNAR